MYFHSLKSGLHSPTLSRFFSWWIKQLGSFLPEKWAKAWRVDDDELQVHVQAEGLNLLWVSNGELVRDFGYFAYQNEDFLLLLKTIREHEHPDIRRVIILPAVMAMQRELSLPAAVESNLHQAVGYEIGRLTPFKYDEVWYDCRITEQQGDKIKVRLSMAPRNMLYDVERFFIEEKCYFYQARVEDDQQLNLIPASLKAGKTYHWQMNYFLIALLFLLCGLWLTVPLILKRQQAIALNHQSVALQEKAIGEDDLWILLNDQKQEIEFFSHKHSYPFSRVLDEISRLLPKDAWITSMSVDKSDILIRGSSLSDAASIVNILASSPLFQKVYFTSPIITAETALRQQSFQIGLELRLPFPVQEDFALQVKNTVDNEQIQEGE